MPGQGRGEELGAGIHHSVYGACGESRMGSWLFLQSVNTPDTAPFFSPVIRSLMMTKFVSDFNIVQVFWVSSGDGINFAVPVVFAR